MRVIAGEKGGRRLVAPAGPGDPSHQRPGAGSGFLHAGERWRPGRCPGLGPLRRQRGAWGSRRCPGGRPRPPSSTRPARPSPPPGPTWPSWVTEPDRARVVCGDALTWAQARGLEHSVAARRTAGRGTRSEVDLVLADPPYAWPGWAALLNELARYSPLVLMETGAEPLLPAPWQALRSKRYGGTLVTLARLRDRGEV